MALRIGLTRVGVQTTPCGTARCPLFGRCRSYWYVLRHRLASGALVQREFYQHSRDGGGTSALPHAHVPDAGAGKRFSCHPCTDIQTSILPFATRFAGLCHLHVFFEIVFLAVQMCSSILENPSILSILESG